MFPLARLADVAIVKGPSGERRSHRPGAGWAIRAGVALAVLASLAACGKKAPPRPPEPRGPLPPGKVEARQLGSRVVVAFEAPRPRGEGPARQPVRAELIRVAYRPGGEAPPDPDAFRRRGEIVAVIERDPLEAGPRISIEDDTWTALADGGTGWTLRYGVRLRDRRARPSPLVVAVDLVPVSPLPQPRDLRAEPTADGVRLAWSPPTGTEPVRFNLYRAVGDGPFGERPVNAQPLATGAYLDSSVDTGRAYRYVVRTTAGGAVPPFRESESSDPVNVVAEDRFAPAPPDGLVAVQEGSAVRLFWDPSEERDLSGYRVYRRADGGPWERLGTDPVPEPQYLDGSVSRGQRLEYRVTAVDRAAPANESEPSSTVEVVVAADPASAERP